MSCSGCGSTSGDTTMRILRGATYIRSVLYTRRDSEGVQVPLDAADYTAELVLRRSYSHPAMLTLTSSPAAGLTLTTEDDSVRVHIEIPAATTEALELGRGFRYTLALTLIADPTQVTILLNEKASVSDTALS